MRKLNVHKKIFTSGWITLIFRKELLHVDIGFFRESVVSHVCEILHIAWIVHGFRESKILYYLGYFGI